MKGKRVCMMHGGKTPVGPAASQYKHGQYSKYLAGRILSRYEEALDAVQVDDQASQIAILDARLAELFDRLDHGESWQAWEEANEALKQFEEALRVNDQQQAGVWLAELKRAIRMGRNDYAAWHEISDHLEQRRKYVESERRQNEKAGLVFNLQEAGALIAAVLAALKKHVEDRATLAAITADIERLTLLPGS